MDRDRLVLMAEHSSAINAYATVHVVAPAAGRPLKALLTGLRRAIGGTAARIGGLARPIGIAVLVLLWVVTIQVLWLFWIAERVLVSVRPSQGSVMPGLVSDQITQTAMAITRIDQNG